MIGEGFRLTYSWIASSAHVSVLLNAYLLDIRAMATSWSRSAEGLVTTLSSEGLRALSESTTSMESRDNVQSVEGPQKVFELCGTVACEDNGIIVRGTLRRSFSRRQREHGLEA